MTIGAFNSPLATMSLNASPARCRSPSPSQQMRAGNPWNAMRSPARSSQRTSDALSRKELAHLAIGLRDVLGIARQRDPAERSLAFAEQRPDVRRHEAGKVERVRDAFVVARPGGCCCRSRTSGCRARGTRASPRRALRSTAAPRQRAPDADRRRAAPPAIARRSSRPAGSRGRDRAPTSGRSPCAATVRRRPRAARAPARARPHCRAGRPKSGGASGTRPPSARAPRRDCAPGDRGSASRARMSMRLCWHSIASIDAPAIVAASGCAPPMPPRPAVRIHLSSIDPP